MSSAKWRLFGLGLNELSAALVGTFIHTHIEDMNVVITVPADVLAPQES